MTAETGLKLFIRMNSREKLKQHLFIAGRQSGKSTLRYEAIKKMLKGMNCTHLFMPPPSGYEGVDPYRYWEDEAKDLPRAFAPYLPRIRNGNNDSWVTFSPNNINPIFNEFLNFNQPKQKISTFEESVIETKSFAGVIVDSFIKSEKDIFNFRNAMMEYVK